VVTSIVSATPAATEAPAILPPSNQSRSHSLSGGAIAGIVIGVIGGLLLAGLLVFCLCYGRRRRNDDPNNADEKDLNRTTSVLSKVGLMRKRGDSAATASHRTPELDGTPITQQQRTPTLPQYVDNRLNPNLASFSVNSRGEPPRQGYGPTGAGGQGLGLGSLGGRHGNGSQGSLGSIQDHVDYSRPLEVRNPDVADD
jgi:cell wall integrity and stress response component